MKRVTLLLILLLVLSVGCIERITTRPAGVDVVPLAGERFEKMMEAPRPEPAGEGLITERKTIVTTNLRLEVKDVKVAVDRITDVAHKFDGYVSYSSINAENKFKTGSITIRVPKEKHDAAVEEITELGEVKSEGTSGRDVTEEYIDLEARLNNLKKQEERLLVILDKAESVEDLLKVEKELARVRGEIESLTGRKKYLDNRIEFSTISVQLREPEPVTYTWGIRGTLRKAIQAFFSVITALVILVGYLLPIAILIGFVLLARRLWSAGKGG